jgi:hypothetical protein
MMNWKDLVRSGRGLILRYNPGIRLDGLKKTTKTSVTIVGRRDLNPGPPEYEAGVLTTGTRRSVSTLVTLLRYICKTDTPHEKPRSPSLS